MIGGRLIERWLSDISRLGIAASAERGVRAQLSSTRARAHRWWGACALARLIDDRSGAVVVIVGFAMTMLVGLAGLATEAGVWDGNKRSMQGAADSAAYSAAIAKNRPPGTSSIFTAEAKSVASTYGYVDGSGQVTVTVNNPPQSGNNTTNNFAIEVTIQQPQKALFSKLFMATPPTIAARAVALLSTSSKCLYALNPNKSGSFAVGGGNVLTSGCGVAVNSNSATALTNSGTLTAPSVDIVGGHSGNPINSPKITTGVIPLSDPLFYVPPPSTAGPCIATNWTKSSGTWTLSQGVYCGGITMKPGITKVTLNPGTYILMGGNPGENGSLNVFSGTLNGTGVTFYNTGDALHPYKSISMQNAPLVTLTAPTSGDLAGMLFFQDRSIKCNPPPPTSAEACLPNVVMGSLTGALYFPSTPLVYETGTKVDVPYTIMVADTISLPVSILNINNDYSSLGGGSPSKEPKLVE